MKDTNKYKLMYLFTYAPVGVLGPLLGQYLNSIGFTGTEIGTVTAVSTGASIIASAFWGERYSNSRDGRKVIMLLCLFAAITGIANLYITGFLLFTISYSIMYFFQGPVMGLCDAMVLENNQNFAPIRLCGSVGYALCVFIGGVLAENIGMSVIFYIYSFTYVIGAMVISTMRNTKHVKHRENESEHRKVRYRDLLKEKKAILLIICGIFVFGTNVANNTYFGFLFTDGGGTVAGVGTVFLLMVGSEAPFMALAPKLAKMVGSEKIIAIAMVISIFRFGMYATGPSYQVLMATFFLQGMVNGVILIEFVKYLSEVVEPRLIAIAVAALYAVSTNGGTIMCNFFGGMAMDAYGSQGVYTLFTILNVIGLLTYLVFGLAKRKNI